MSATYLPSNDALLEQSRSYCEHLTRTQARNFYYGLRLLPEAKRAAMFAIYAYMRRVDDIADDDDGRTVQQRLEELDSWQARTRAALSGEPANGQADPLWHAFAHAASRYNVPGYVFDEVIEGQRQDLEPRPFADFEELKAYCYRVAGVVGISSICVWGYQGGEETEALAIERGLAFQLTNVLRDLREDASRGRTYLPADEMSAMNITSDDLEKGGPRFCEMMRFQIERARRFYSNSADLENRVSRDSRPTLRAMTDIYQGLLDKIAVDPQRVLNERVSLSVLSKLRIGWRALRAG